MSSKKKVRVALRKNRGHRARDNDLTRAFLDGETEARAGTRNDDVEDAALNERVRAKGELSRHRTIMQAEPTTASEARDEPDDDASQSRSIDLSACLAGRVVRVHGLISSVVTADGRSFACRTRRLLKSLSIDARNVIAPGDRVWIRPEPGGGGEAVVERVEPRRGVITRGYRNHKHIIAANIDQVLIVSAFAEPGLKPALIDRYLISAESGGVRPVVVFNKADLVDVGPFQWVVGLYAQLGYETIATSARDGRGLGRIRELLASGTTALSGQSGVGKSSLLNAVEPGLGLRVREVSDWTFKGKHTTTTAELIRLESGGEVIDTPGLRQFELWGLERTEIPGMFVEFRPYLRLCRFPDCTHTHEIGCGVKDAVRLGQIHLARYESYLKLYHQKEVKGS